MTEVLTAAQMRAVEAAAIESGTVTGLELMERAGRGVVEAIFKEWPALRATSHRAVVLCGPGNNGGDGFVVARLLKEWGWGVRVLFAGLRDGLSPEAKAMFDAWAALGPIKALNDTTVQLRPRADLFVDAIFGTGLSRPPAGDILKVLSRMGGRNGDGGYYLPRTVSIDAPSGLCLDSGRCLYDNLNQSFASLTVTFDSAKVGHFLDEGPRLCGKVVVVDIGLTPVRLHDQSLRQGGAWQQGHAPMQLGLVEQGSHRDFSLAVLPSSRLSKRNWGLDHAAHKFSHGHAIILSGGITSSGAARLAARGALRIGAGVVTLGCPPSAVVVNAAHLNAVMLKPITNAAALAELLQDARINALCLGPGMGTTAKQAELLATALDQRRGAIRPTVLDADALTLLARDAALFERLHKNCILTPHAGEFARLFPDIAAKLNEPANKGPAYSKVDACREAAKRAGCVVLFKGADTVIAAHDGRCSINAAVYDRAAPWLATAGSGDVLAGFITGLLARGFAPMQAAEAGSWLHVECAISFGPGLIAEDLPENLPKVFRALGL